LYKFSLERKRALSLFKHYCNNS